MRCADRVRLPPGLSGEPIRARPARKVEQAVQNGFKDLQLWKKDPNLAPLRSRADFQELVAELEKKLRPD
jgi:hypothetical protein